MAKVVWGESKVLCSVLVDNTAQFTSNIHIYLGNFVLFMSNCYSLCTLRVCLTLLHAKTYLACKLANLFWVRLELNWDCLLQRVPKGVFKVFHICINELHQVGNWSRVWFKCTKQLRCENTLSVHGFGWSTVGNLFTPSDCSSERPTKFDVFSAFI